MVIYSTNGLFSSFFLVILTKDLFYLSFQVTSFLFAYKGIRILLYISSFSFIFISSFFLLSYGLFWVLYIASWVERSPHLFSVLFDFL